MSDTVQDLRLSRKLVYRQGVRDMRERAAKAARLEAEEALIAIAMGRMDRNTLPIVVMNAVKALPIDPETGGADG